jgi:hypothetical protein
MVAMTVEHHPIEVGTPFYAGHAKSGPDGEAGAPVLHKFDSDDFVPRLFAEVGQAERTGQRPPSLLGPIRPSPLPDYDTDALDFLGHRFRKLFQPVHFRFYLAACELCCLVPGLPAPSAKKVKKVELVIRRVAVRKEAPVPAGAPGAKPGAGPVIERREWAWVRVPEPELFPGTPPPAPVELASRLTGNTHTWWPIPREETALEEEQRFPMARIPGLKDKAVYFAFLPVSSGEMYGPRPVPVPLKAAGDPGEPPRPRTSWNRSAQAPLIPAPSQLALRPASLRSWSTPDWRQVLGRFTGGQINGPRPKFESPPLDGDPDSGWAYVVRCVATLEQEPGCVVEKWGPPTSPMLIAPVFDPFGGRPTQVELPSLAGIKKMLGNLTAAQLAQRGGLGLGIAHSDCYPAIKMDGVDPLASEDGSDLGSKSMGKMSIGASADCKQGGGAPEVPQVCFWPTFVLTILAYLMINIALAIMLIFNWSFSFFLKIKFCIGLMRKAA